jgi:cytoskeletal protein CcmA (bactofilin family)
MIWRRDEQREEQPAPVQRPPVQEEQRERPRDRDERHEGRRRMAEEREVTIVGQGASLEGNIVSAGSLRVDGKVKGQINADGDVIISPQSQVDADIKAENVTVAGKFTGNIVVKGTAELTRGGRVDGNVTSKTLVVQEGAIFQGQSIMDQQAQQAAQSPPPQQQQGAKQAAQQPSPTEKPEAAKSRV